jgi:predicted nucleic acid binding AN1-type Zn finger protein
MKGDLFCVSGRIMRHDPQPDDPELETDIGQCPHCGGQGCSDDGGPVEKHELSKYWMRDHS